MATDNIISRADAEALIPEEVSSDIIKTLPEQSWALQTFRKVNMGRKQTRLPVISALPAASFVNGDTGLKQTTEVNWDDVFLIAEEIACIVPIPEAVLDDTQMDIWGEIKPLIAEAFGITLDAAVAFGTNKPASWPTAIVPGAVAASNTVTHGANNAAAGGIASDISDVQALVENDGFDVNTFAAVRSLRGTLRKARDTTGQKLSDVTPTEIDGVPVSYPMSGQWPTASGTAELIAGDKNQAIIGLRQDITYKILDQAVITDSEGNIVYNFGQQDMVGLRCVARFAFALPNPINRSNSGSNRYPFAALLRA